MFESQPLREEAERWGFLAEAQSVPGRGPSLAWSVCNNDLTDARQGGRVVPPRNFRGSMSPSSEWQFDGWPLNVRSGIRVIHLSEAVQVPNSVPRDEAARALPCGEPVSASELRKLESSVLDWEAEGGSFD